MAISYGFIDGALYGTDDINNITRNLVGAGIAPFIEKESYNVSDLNVMTEAVVSAGTQLDGCQCTVSGIGNPEITVSVAQGIIFFDSGVRLEVDSEGYDILVPANTAGYVFAHFSSSLQKADIVFEEELRSDGENVLLAKILKNGYVEDRRQFAVSKVASLGKNVVFKTTFERLEKPELYDGKYIVLKIVGVDLSRFNYAILVSSEYHGDVNFKFFPDTGYYASFFDLNRGEQDFALYNSGDFVKKDDTKLFFKTATGYSYYAGIANGELCVMSNCDQENAEVALNDAFGCTVCLM